MFKRIGATILTIVMLLSMASVFASASELEMGLEVVFADRDGNELQSIARGQAVYAIVKIKNPIAISGMSIAGNYSGADFTADGDAEVIAHTFGETELKGFGEAGEDKVLAAWIAEENVTLADGAELMRVPLVVNGDAALDNAEVSFRFINVYVAENGAPVEADPSLYSAEVAKAVAAVVPATNTILSVNGPESAKVGEEITITVGVNEYADNWSAMTIVGTYNAEVLELKGDIEPEAFGTEEATIKTESGKMGITWINENVVDTADSFTALTMTFTVKAVGDANLSFSFLEDGIYGVDTENPLTAGFSKQAIKKELHIAPAIEPVELEIEAPETAKVGKTIEVKVNVKNYADNWAAMTIKGTYDSTKLELLEKTPVEFKDSVSGTEPVFSVAEGVLGVTWLNIEPVAMGEEFTALTLKFRVLEMGDAGLSFSFVPDGILNGEGELVPAEHFQATAAEAVVDVNTPATKTSLLVSTDKTAAKVGETVEVTVKVKDYANNWSAMTIMGEYDPAKLELLSHTEEEFSDGGSIQIPPVFDDANGVIQVNWTNLTAVEMSEEFTALTLTFKVNAEGESGLKFFFKPDGILDANGAPATDTYEEAEVPAEVTLLPQDKKTYLNVDMVGDSAEVGQEITVLVDVKDYADNWTAMMINGSYDPNLLAVKTIKPIAFGTAEDQAAGFEPVIKYGDGEIKVCWISSDAAVMGNDFQALEITFTVLRKGEAEVGFAFDPNGILDIYDDVPTGTFVTEEVTDKAELIHVSTAYLDVNFDQTKVQLGDTVTVRVSVNDYISNWIGMMIRGSYDPTLLKVESIVPKNFTNQAELDAGFEPVIKNENGVITVTWINTELVEKTETSFEVLEITFTALQEGTANVGFGFVPDQILGENEAPVPETWYDATVKTDEVVMESNETLLAVEGSKDRIKVGEQVSYKVSLKDYKDNWMAMALAVQYNANELKFISATTDAQGFAYFEADGESVDGVVNIAWVNGTPVALGKNADVLTITFEAVSDCNAEVSFGFKGDGIIAEDFATGTAIYAPAGTFQVAPEKETVEIFAAPSLVINGESLAQQGEDYTASLVLKDYNDTWSSFGAELVYNTNVFRVKSIDAKKIAGLDAEVIQEDGKIRLAWNNGNANIQADELLELLNVTFEVIGYDDDAVFNATLVDVKTFNGSENVTVDPYEVEAIAEALHVCAKKIKTPQLNIVVEPSMDEGTNGVLKLYLNEYHSEWNSIPVVLTFDSALVRIDEDGIVCNALGDVVGQYVVREDGKVVFTWVAAGAIVAEGESIEIATIPFYAYKEGEATFAAEFITDSVKVPNAQGGYDTADTATYIPKAEDQKVTIIDKFDNLPPMYLTIDTVKEAMKGKDATISIKMKDFNPRVQALSVKLYYDKEKVSITEENVKDLLGGENIVGAVYVNEEEGYVQFVWVSTAGNMVNSAEALLANITYTPIADGKASFYAVIEQALNTEEKEMAPTWEYTERTDAIEVLIKATPGLTVSADKTDVKIGDKITVNIAVSDYLNNWSGMTISGSFDKDMLELESIVLSDAFGNGRYELNAAGDSFAAVWSNAQNILKDASGFDMITLVFKAKDGGVANIEILLDQVVTNGTTSLVPDEDYLLNAEGVKEINIAVCEHVWGDAVVHKDGTSGEESMHLRYCSKGCGAAKEEACSLTVTTKESNDPCEKAGTATYTCSVCGYSETVEDPNAPALGHKFDGKPVHKANTDKHVYTCTRKGCGETKEETCTGKVQVVAPTCVKDGYTVRFCDICGDSHIADVVKASGKHGALTLHYIAATATTDGAIITQCDTCKEYVVPPYAGAVKKTLKAGHPFPDVQDPKSWYYDAVNFNKAFEIFGGDELGNFNPDANITRGQLVTVLGRIINAEAEKTMTAAQFNAYLNAQTSKVSGMSSASGFTDLSGKYYERYAKLFAKWGIVNGYPDGTFGGDKNITREEMATLIKRFVEAYGANVNTIKFGNAATFSDFSTVSGWAKGNVEWVGKVGLFQGDASKKYNPKNNATRAEIAVVIYRMLPELKDICVCINNH